MRVVVFCRNGARFILAAYFSSYQESSGLKHETKKKSKKKLRSDFHPRKRGVRRRRAIRVLKIIF